MGCKKVFHITEAGAKMHAASLALESGGVVPNVYYCESCRAWHVGFDGALRHQMGNATRRKYEARRRRSDKRRR